MHPLSCLNRPHSSWKYASQFFLINIPENLLRALKQLVFLGHLNLFEFFFHDKKQVEVIGSSQANRMGVAFDA
jgi:hypothetical protein